MNLLKTFSLFCLLVLGLSLSNAQVADNRFSQEESYHSIDNQVEGDVNLPPPVDPVPIDDYIPFLVAGALVLIAWYGRGRLRTQE